MRSILPFVLLLLASPLFAAEPPAPLPGNAMLKEYFARQVEEIENAQKLPLPASLAEWEKTRQQWRAELADMLGLNPMPARTPLNVVKTGEVAGEGFVVENLHFQSMPGLYVTANFYRPTKVEQPLPAILYGCGHSDVKAKDGGSLGNKTYYQHHGEWFARHGYVCLVIDTVQLGEIRGEHHGTYKLGRWWWMARGYTPAGVEAWAGIRSLDYLETRPEVDRTRIGMTGRSGGGAYSWWVSALDDRIKVSVPTAGITTLRNHVVDGTVEGHCDCMFMVNTRRWDYDKLAALIAPRPLLIANTDKDTIFPLDGVMNVYNHVRALYKALGKEGNIGLQIAEGPHKDTQPLNAGAFAWFERFLKGADPMALLDEPASKRLDPEVLRVFKSLPKDEINTHIDEQFVKAAAPAIPADAAGWEQQRAAWLTVLRSQVFAGWPALIPKPQVILKAEGASEESTLKQWEFTSEAPWRLQLHVVARQATKAKTAPLKLVVIDESGYDGFAKEVANGRLPGPDVIKENEVVAFVALRGIGPTKWSGDSKALTHQLRRFYLLGQTLDGQRVLDICQAVAALREAGYRQPITLEGQGAMAVNVLYASILLEDGVASVSLWSPSTSHTAGPTYLNVLRYLDVPQALLLAAARCPVRVNSSEKAAWDWTQQSAGKLGLAEKITFGPAEKNAPWPYGATAQK